jgi:hypothetical protein
VEVDAHADVNVDLSAWNLTPRLDASEMLWAAARAARASSSSTEEEDSERGDDCPSEEYCPVDLAAASRPFK